MVDDDEGETHGVCCTCEEGIRSGRGTQRRSEQRRVTQVPRTNGSMGFRQTPVSNEPTRVIKTLVWRRNQSQYAECPAIQGKDEPRGMALFVLGASVLSLVGPKRYFQTIDDAGITYGITSPTVVRRTPGDFQTEGFSNTPAAVVVGAGDLDLGRLGSACEVTEHHTGAGIPTVAVFLLGRVGEYRVFIPGHRSYGWGFPTGRHKGCGLLTGLPGVEKDLAVGFVAGLLAWTRPEAGVYGLILIASMAWLKAKPNVISHSRRVGTCNGGFSMADFWGLGTQYLLGKDFT